MQVKRAILIQAVSAAVREQKKQEADSILETPGYKSAYLQALEELQTALKQGDLLTIVDG